MMSDPPDSNELTPDDLDIIRGFLAADDFATHDDNGVEPGIATAGGQAGAFDEVGEEEEMLSIFVTEVDEDIADMQRALTLLRQDQSLATLPASSQMPRPALSALRRGAHKIRGTAAAIGCSSLSTIAHSIETLIELAHGQHIEWHTGLLALGYAIDALRETLESVAAQGQESILPLLTLEEQYADLRLPMSSTGRVGHMGLTDENAGDEPDEVGGVGGRGAWGGALIGEMMEDMFYAPEWADRLAQLLAHVEQLGERQHEIEDARREVEAALAELRASQTRLRRIETFVTALPISSPSNAAAVGARQFSLDELAPSSLVARILREADQRTGHAYQPRPQAASTAMQSPFSASSALAETMLWDELELDHFTETHMLARSLNEAIADVATATAQLQLALLHLDALNRQQANMTALIQSDALQITPASQTLYEAGGAAPGLLARVGEQLVIVPFAQTRRIEYADQPSSKHVYALGDLLGFPAPVNESAERILPLLIMRSDPLETSGVSHDEQHIDRQIAIQVDEAVGQVELRIKPLPPSLRRPGVTGAAITRAGEVALALDLVTLIRRYEERKQPAPGRSEHVGGEEVSGANTQANGDEALEAQQTQRQAVQAPRVLIVDDSVYMRRSLANTLASKGYRLFEARDGIEALEQLTAAPGTAPDVLLLDLEMPNLNGYELLNILRARALLPDLKVILLTARASDKHQKRARELGIHAYLTKPCTDEKLLTTVAGVLTKRSKS